MLRTPQRLHLQWTATRVLSASCGALVLTGLLILWFGARGLFATGVYSCVPSGCNFPPPVEILTAPVALVLGGCAVVLVIVGMLPRLWPAGTVAGILTMSMWWFIEDQLAPLHPPVAGWEFPLGIAATLVGGAFGLTASVWLRIISVLR
jgi:hypothetical protein